MVIIYTGSLPGLEGVIFAAHCNLTFFPFHPIRSDHSALTLLPECKASTQPHLSPSLCFLLSSSLTSSPVLAPRCRSIGIQHALACCLCLGQTLSSPLCLFSHPPVRFYTGYVDQGGLQEQRCIISSLAPQRQARTSTHRVPIACFGHPCSVLAPSVSPQQRVSHLFCFFSTPFCSLLSMSDVWFANIASLILPTDALRVWQADRPGL